MDGETCVSTIKIMRNAMERSSIPKTSSTALSFIFDLTIDVALLIVIAALSTPDEERHL